MTPPVVPGRVSVPNGTKTKLSAISPAFVRVRFAPIAAAAFVPRITLSTTTRTFGFLFMSQNRSTLPTDAAELKRHAKGSSFRCRYISGRAARSSSIGKKSPIRSAGADSRTSIIRRRRFENLAVCGVAIYGSRQRVSVDNEIRLFRRSVAIANLNLDSVAGGSVPDDRRDVELAGDSADDSARRDASLLHDRFASREDCHELKLPRRGDRLCVHDELEPRRPGQVFILPSGKDVGVDDAGRDG